MKSVRFTEPFIVSKDLPVASAFSKKLNVLFPALSVNLSAFGLKFFTSAVSPTYIISFNSMRPLMSALPFGSFIASLPSAVPLQYDPSMVMFL